MGNGIEKHKRKLSNDRRRKGNVEKCNQASEIRSCKEGKKN